MPFRAVWSFCFFFPLNHALVDRISFCLVQERSPVLNLVEYSCLVVWLPGCAQPRGHLLWQHLPGSSCIQSFAAARSVSGWTPAHHHPVSTPTPKVVSESPLVTYLVLWPVWLPQPISRNSLLRCLHRLELSSVSLFKNITKTWTISRVITT